MTLSDEDHSLWASGGLCRSLTLSIPNTCNNEGFVTFGDTDHTAGGCEGHWPSHLPPLLISGILSGLIHLVTKVTPQAGSVPFPVPSHLPLLLIAAII